LRAVSGTPDGLAAVISELRAAQRGDRRFDEFCLKLSDDLADRALHQGQARRLVERLVLALQGALLIKDGAAAIADAFCASRLDGDGGGAFGTLPSGVDASLIARHAAPLGAA
jgi:putative acyl-CoA dehydrogenase